MPFTFLFFSFSFCQEGQHVSGLDVGQSRGKGHSQDPHPRSFPTCVRPTARDSVALHTPRGGEKCLMQWVGGKNLETGQDLESSWCRGVEHCHASRTPNPFKLSLCIDVLFGMAAETFAPIGSARGISGEVKKESRWW